jgi:hypothetical protein
VIAASAMPLRIIQKAWPMAWLAEEQAIASLPIAFFYNLFLDRFIAGFTAGAVKG